MSVIDRAQTMPKRQRPTIVVTAPATNTAVTENESVALERGGYKRRRVGAKKWQYMCEHDHRRSQCKECGGSGICEHGRERCYCKECGGASICEHGRERSTCKECGGSGICEHGRIRNTCKECGGSSICEHGRRRDRCKECGGSSMCEHGRRRARCKDCLLYTSPSPRDRQKSRMPSSA